MRRSKPNPLDEASLYDYAIAALGRRMHSVAELKRKLRNRCAEEATIEKVVARLKEHKYLNDAGYAAAYSAFRRDNEKFGRRRVTTDLKVKGVHADVIEKAVDEAYSSVDEVELARAFLRRKRLKKPATNREAARIFRALMRAGFGIATSVAVLKTWNVDDEVLTAFQEEADR
jgi:regulatory protein